MKAVITRARFDKRMNRWGDNVEAVVDGVATFAIENGTLFLLDADRNAMLMLNWVGNDYKIRYDREQVESMETETETETEDTA